MTKRKLTIKQKRQITENKTKNNIKINIDLIDKSQDLVVAHFGKTIQVMNKNGDIINCKYRQNLGTIVTGDEVVWYSQLNSDEGIVTSLMPRTDSVLARPTRFHPEPKIIAANINQIIVVIAVEPEPIEHYIDRYLVIASTMNIKPIIILNKSDLLDDKNDEYFTKIIKMYQDIGYNCFKISALTQDSKEQLKNIFMSKTSIIVGQSGVGKSAILNTINEKEKIKVGNISKQNMRGCHTTTTSRMYFLNDKSMIIDSPGIREFGIWNLTINQLCNGFIEFKEYIGQCRFRTCNHEENAKGCKIVEALHNNLINKNRFKNFHRLRQEIIENIQF